MQGVTILAAASADAAQPTDASWQLETSWQLAPWVTVLLVIGVVLLVAYCYSRELSTAGRGYRALLGGLRLVTIVLLLAMLSEMLLSGTRSGRPTFAVLLDRSGSMQVADPLGETLPQSLRSATFSSDPPRRVELAAAVLTAGGIAGEQTLLSALAEDYDLRVYRCAETVDQIEQPSSTDPSDDQPSSDESSKEFTSQQLIGEANQGSLTRLGDAIESLVAGGNVPPQGMLILSDGQVTAGSSLVAAAESARRTGVPLYLVGIGSEEAPPDIALGDLLAEEVVFVDDFVSFRATLRGSAAASGPVRVVLRRVGSERVLAEQTVEIPVGGGGVPVQLLDRPTQPGSYRYEISARPVDDKVAAAELETGNNQLSHTLSVRDQQVRVLIAAGYPNYEYRYIKHLLERDSTVDLRVFLQEADVEYATADAAAVNRLPLRRRDFEKFDVVLLMDLDPRLSPRSFWPALREFVASSGGGLAMIAGPRYLPDAYGSFADFKPLYPAELGGSGAGSSSTTGFRLQPTPLGLRHAALQLAEEATENQLVWQRLPQLYWYRDLGKPKPAAQVLAVHPTATGAEGGPVPLVLSQYFGAGQVVLHGIDSTYRWRLQVGDVYFARYWVQMVRGLARGRLTAGDKGQQIVADRRQYQPGEPVRLRMNLGGAPLAAGDSVSVLLQPEKGPQQRIKLTPATEASRVLSATLDDLPVGSYRVLSSVSGAASEPLVTEFEVVAPPGEYTRLEMNAEAMQAAAQRSRGKFYRLQEFERFAAELPAARRVAIETLPPIELWNRWWMLAAICGCLTTEWILRKRKAML